MSMTENIRHLLDRYYCGNASPEEIRQIGYAYNSPPGSDSRTLSAALRGDSRTDIALKMLRHFNIINA